jgi:autotransporter adhesin
MGGNAITNLAAPVAAGDATNKGYVDGIAAAAAGTTSQLGQTTAAALGGGAAYDPATGKISSPSYSVGGTATTSVGGAVAALQTASPLQYSTAAAPTKGNGYVPSQQVTLVGANAAAPVTLNNVAAGAVNATSNQAVNGAQLYAVQQVAANSLQYDKNADGSPNYGSVTLGGGTPGAPTQIHNVADGLAATDVATVGQLTTGLGNALKGANGYTDTQIANVRFDLKQLDRKFQGATAGSDALAMIPQPMQPGQGGLGMGMAAYGDAIGFAIGASKAFKDGHTVVKAAVSWATQGKPVHVGIGAFYGF